MDATTTATAEDSLGPVIGTGIDGKTVPVSAYQPLSPGSNTRILELQSSVDPTAPLVGQLAEANVQVDISYDYSTFDYERNYDYETISYCWGEPIFTEPLTLRNSGESGTGAIKYITANLRDALLRFRSANEKEAQIRHMAAIYESASGVLIWLGHSEDGEDCFRRLEMLTRGGAEELPWFSRLWVVQELVKIRNITMFCGRATMPWLRLLPVIARDWLSHLPYSNPILYTLAKLWKHWFDHQMIPRGDLIGLLEDFDDMKCANEKERVFPLFGLSWNASCGRYCTSQNHVSHCSFRLELDYTWPTEELYGYVLGKSILEESCHASTALRIAATRNLGGDTERPSWAIDWRQPKVRESIWHNRKKWFCGGFEQRDSCIVGPESLNRLILCVDFAAWGDVATVLSPLAETSTEEQAMEWLSETWSRLLEWVRAHNSGITPSTLQQHLLLEQLLDAIFVFAHDDTHFRWVYAVDSLTKGVRARMVLGAYRGIRQTRHGSMSSSKDSDEEWEAYDQSSVRDDDFDPTEEDWAARELSEEMPSTIQRYMRGRSVCIMSSFTHKTARVNGMVWPDIGIAPSHVHQGDIVVMAFASRWKDRYPDLPTWAVPNEMKPYSLQYVEDAESAMMLLREIEVHARPREAKCSLVYEGKPH
ncbi:heterokaryon incompatibility protein-domain-containing protein [Apiospora rasikravindrae]|uniref:Heterokaryon incompatibility protein-domain-containing protein n=1 Tax=Apiospora rasikravindrae TaxID=990691 RepID=A0ABR1TGB9_9PEZI